LSEDIPNDENHNDFTLRLNKNDDIAEFKEALPLDGGI